MVSEVSCVPDPVRCAWFDRCAAQNRPAAALAAMSRKPGQQPQQPPLQAPLPPALYSTPSSPPSSSGAGAGSGAVSGGYYSNFLGSDADDPYVPDDGAGGTIFDEAPPGASSPGTQYSDQDILDSEAAEADAEFEQVQSPNEQFTREDVEAPFAQRTQQQQQQQQWMQQPQQRMPQRGQQLPSPVVRQPPAAANPGPAQTQRQPVAAASSQLPPRPAAAPAPAAAAAPAATKLRKSGSQEGSFGGESSNLDPPPRTLAAPAPKRAAQPRAASPAAPRQPRSPGPHADAPRLTISQHTDAPLAPSASAAAVAALSGAARSPPTSSSPPPPSSGSLPAAPPQPSSGSSSAVGKIKSALHSNLRELEKSSAVMIDSIRGLEDPAAKKGVTLEDTQLASLNYDLMEDHVNAQALESKWHGYVLTSLQIGMTVMIAFVTAAAMFFVSRVVEALGGFRVETTLEIIRDGDHYYAYLALLGISLMLALLATSLVTLLAPHSKGGGVPYVQAYLNGTNVASYFSLRIVLVKVVALAFTISAGLSVGMEGPFVFIGSGIAILAVKAVETLSFHQRLGGRYARILKNSNEERVFMAGGMAAGLAVAFNAPVAGVLMALEGSTAFLTVPVVLRIFGCAMFATFFNDLGHANFSQNIKTHNLISISTPTGLAGSQGISDDAWVLWEIIAFAFISFLGGALGALAIWINVRVTKWRHHKMEPHPPQNRLNIAWAIGEVLVIAFATATAWFVLPYVFGCRVSHEQCFPTLTIPLRCAPVQCPDKFYSEIGTIIYSSPDTIARILFDRTLLPANDIQPFPLIVYAAFYICFVSIAYGAHVPGGLFVPSVVVGGCMGRVVGFCVHNWISSTINPGVYALLGAAAMFGGFTRLALPAVVMLTEMTGDATYLLPIMFCTVLAKVSSDLMQPPLYPQHMAIEGIPTLGDKLNPLIAPLSAKHIMQRTFYSVVQVDTLDHILSVLDSSRSMLLPVVTSDGKFVGMIMRRSVIYALKYTKMYESMEQFQAEVDDPFATREIHSAQVDSGKSDSGVSQGLASGGAAAGGSTPASNVTAVQQRKAKYSNMLEVEKKMGDVKETSAFEDMSDEIKSKDEYANHLINLAPFMDAGQTHKRRSTQLKAILCPSHFDSRSCFLLSLSVRVSGALTAHEETSAKRIAAIFRRVGISHLAVSDANNKLVGVITRRHLIKPPPAITATLAPQKSVQQLLADADLRASPEAVLDLQAYDASTEFEQSAMDHLGSAQTRAALARRSNSILGDDPAVRFDDEEDPAEVDAPEDDEDDHSPAGVDGGRGGDDGGIAGTMAQNSPWNSASPSLSPSLYDDGEGGSMGDDADHPDGAAPSPQQMRAFREATGLTVPQTPNPNAAAGARTPLTSRPSHRRKESTMDRRAFYMRQLG